MGDNKETKEVAKTENVDEELSDLLDSALEDFSKKPKEEEKAVEKAESSGGDEASAEALDMEKIMKEFETSMLPLLMNADNMSADEEETFKKMTESARQVLLNPGDDSSAFASFLAEGLQASQNEQMPNMNMPADVMKAFSDPTEQGAFLQFLQGMMQSVLRKDMIYPGVKHIADLYPAWLETNKEKISAEDSDRYHKQLALMQEVCTVLESEQESDSAEVRVQRMEKVIGLMQKLHDYGDVPEDLIGTIEPPPMPYSNLQLQDLQAVDAGDNQCCLM